MDDDDVLGTLWILYIHGLWWFWENLDPFRAIALADWLESCLILLWVLVLMNSLLLPSGFTGAEVWFWSLETFGFVLAGFLLLSFFPPLYKYFFEDSLLHLAYGLGIEATNMCWCYIAKSGSDHLKAFGFMLPGFLLLSFLLPTWQVWPCDWEWGCGYVLEKSLHGFVPIWMIDGVLGTTESFSSQGHDGWGDFWTLLRCFVCWPEFWSLHRWSSSWQLC